MARQTQKNGGTRAEAIAAQIRRRIVEGSYRANSFLPTTRELVGEFGASSRTISEALAILAEEKLVSLAPRRAGMVLEPSERLNGKPIAVVTWHIQHDVFSPVAMDMCRAALDTFKRRGYPAELVGAAFDIKTDEGMIAIDSLDDLRKLAERFSGLLFAKISTGVESFLQALEDEHYPLAVAGLEHDVNLLAAWTDHGKASRTAVQALAGMRHRRIAYIGRRPDFVFYGQAFRGYLDGLDAAGVERDDALIAFTDKTYAMDAWEAARPLLEMKHPPTAFVTARDVLAQGICRAVTDKGLVPGRDVSIIGYDGYSWRDGAEELTTFIEPGYRMGATAADLLVDRLANGWRPPRKVEVDAEFVIRASIGPLFAASAATRKG